MSRLIDADALRRKMCAACISEGIVCTDFGNKCFEVSFVDSAPTIDAEPVKRGEWIQYNRNADETYIECSNCCVASRPRHLQMVTRTGSGLPDYCPNCGAKMNDHIADASKKVGADNDR